MGYSLHVERPNGPISQEDWEAWINTQPNFTLSREFRSTNPATGEEIVIPCTALGEWTRPGGQGVSYFDYRKGRITADGDDDNLTKLKEIAEAFGAQVVGDEGEIYYPSPDTGLFAGLKRFFGRDR